MNKIFVDSDVILDLLCKLQYFTAAEHKIKIILTRNIKDYKGTAVSIQTPEQFIKMLKLKA